MTTIRSKVLSVLDDKPRTGKAVAERAGVGYEQTIQALNSLLWSARVVRVGAKASARWMAVNRPFSGAQHLADAMKRWKPTRRTKQ